MKKIYLWCTLFLLATNLYAQQLMPLWPKGKMPNSKGLDLKDSIADGQIFQLSEPRMCAYLATKDKNTGTAILIIPGGGYLRMSSNFTTIPSALYYQSMGINAFVVWHRLPASPDLIHPEQAPLQDIQRAMRIIYANTAKWRIDPKHIGVFGTSAGGHGATTLATHLEDVSAIGDSLDKYPYKPAFSILVSPVISFKNGIVHKGSRDRLLGESPSQEMINTYSNETRVTKETPPALLFHADDDPAVPSMNNLVYYQALKAAKVSASLHIFPFGAHRINIESHPGSSALWPQLSLEWLKEMGFLSEKGM